MKKFYKFISISILAALLAGCTQGNDKPEETTVETTVAETTTETTQAPESQKEESKPENEDESKESEEANEDAAKFAVYVSGEEEPIAEFTVPDAEGMSVLDALESSNLDVVFSEEMGVVMSIEGYENDYDTEETWTYVYNGGYAELGVISQTLSPGDEVDWYYGTIEEIPVNLIQE